MEIVLAKLEYEDTGFSPTMIERVNSKKNRMKLKVNLINVMGGGLMNKFFMRISLTLIIYKNRKAAYLSARAPVPTKIDSPCFCRALGSSFRSPGCRVWRLSRCSFSFVWSVLCFRPAFRSSLATLFVLFHIWHKKPGKLLQLCRERSLWSSRYCFRSRCWTSRSSLHCCCGRQWSFLWFL